MALKKVSKTSTTCIRIKLAGALLRNSENVRILAPNLHVNKEDLTTPVETILDSDEEVQFVPIQEKSEAAVGHQPLQIQNVVSLFESRASTSHQDMTDEIVLN